MLIFMDTLHAMSFIQFNSIQFNSIQMLIDRNTDQTSITSGVDLMAVVEDAAGDLQRSGNFFI